MPKTTSMAVPNVLLDDHNYKYKSVFRPKKNIINGHKMIFFLTGSQKRTNNLTPGTHVLVSKFSGEKWLLPKPEVAELLMARDKNDRYKC